MIQKVFMLVLTLTPYIQAKCDKGCEDNTLDLLYEDINCKPIYEKETDCCPTKYDCSHLEETKEDHCLFQGKFYKVGEEFPKEKIYANCQVGCRCFEKNKVICAVLDCPEWLGAPVPFRCYRTYELGKCCSVGHKCPNKEKIFKCKVGNETYSEGEKFSAPNKRCFDCVCQKGFKGEFVEPFCRKAGCTSETRHSEDIRKNCAPVFSGPDSCCPHEWICPDDDLDKFEPNSKGKENSENQCKYGTKLLNINEKFERTVVISEYEKTETKCECKVPPMTTCYMKHVYDIEKAPEHIRPYLT